VIAVNTGREGLEQRFAEVELAARVDCGRCMPYENGAPIWIARRPVVPIREIWPHAKHFD
jgi:hypothetical protein